MIQLACQIPKFLVLRLGNYSKNYYSNYSKILENFNQFFIGKEVMHKVYLPSQIWEVNFFELSRYIELLPFELAIMFFFSLGIKPHHLEQSLMLICSVGKLQYYPN